MILIYYRDKNGKILRYHLPPEGWTQEKLEAEMAKFNAPDRDAKVFQQEIKEDSLEMFLYESAGRRRRYPKELIEAALDAISEARDAIIGLDMEED